MNESIIEHPISKIDFLLKMGKGDKGRLLYLKKALINGKTIYESDKKYLKQIQIEIPENGDFSNDSKSFKDQTKNNLNQKNFLTSNNSKVNQSSIHSNDKEQIENANGIQSIQSLLEDIKNKDSKINDSLELLVVNRQFFSDGLKPAHSSFVNDADISKELNSDLFGSVNQRNRLEQFHFFGLKKHDLMLYASAGTFSLWFSSFMNLVDLGPMKGLVLGLSAGSAVAAGLYFKRYKKNSTPQNLK